MVCLLKCRVTTPFPLSQVLLRTGQVRFPAAHSRQTSRGLLHRIPLERFELLLLAQ